MVSPLEGSKGSVDGSRDRRSLSKGNEGRFEDEGSSPFKREASEAEEAIWQKGMILLLIFIPLLILFWIEPHLRRGFLVRG